MRCPWGRGETSTASSRVGADPRGHGLGGGGELGQGGGGAELQQDPQIGRFLIKEQLNERKTHKVRKLLGCFSSAAKRNPFNESEKGRGRGGGGDQTGTAPPGLGAASLLLLLLVLQEERRPVTAGSVAPVPPPTAMRGRFVPLSLPSRAPGSITHLGHAQDDQELPEDVDEVEEEIDAVPAGTEGRAQGGPSCPGPPPVPSTHQM